LVDQIICPITNSWFAGISEVASRPNILQNLWAYRKEIIEKKKKKHGWMKINVTSEKKVNTEVTMI
jgi:hypothetical protein